MPHALPKDRLPRAPLNNGVPRREGVLSLVVDRNRGKVRRLPSLYLGTSQIFADRDVDRVIDRLVATAAAVVRGKEEPTFMLHACKFAGMLGLYGRDFFNRAVYRRKLQRLGMRFATDSLVRMTAQGSFECADWGEFTPRFVVLGMDAEDPTVVVRTRGAELLFRLASTSLGDVSPADLKRLLPVALSLPALSAARPEALVGALERL